MLTYKYDQYDDVLNCKNNLVRENLKFVYQHNNT